MRPAIEKPLGIGVAALSLIMPALILPLRSRFCRRFEVRDLDFYPLSGDVNGYAPQLFTRIMHNLTHPLFVCAYAVVLALVAIRIVVRPSLGAFRQYLLVGLLCVTTAYLGLYSYSISLPVGDLSTYIRP